MRSSFDWMGQGLAARRAAAGPDMVEVPQLVAVEEPHRRPAPQQVSAQGAFRLAEAPVHSRSKP